MKIGIDGRAAKWYRGTGIGTYTYQLINNLSIVDSSNQYLILLPQNTDLVLKDNFTIECLKESSNNHFWDDVKTPNLLKNNKMDLYHVPQNGVGLSENINCLKAITLHDIIPLKLPETVSDRYLKIFNEELPKIISNCDGIITVSDFSKEDIAKEFNIEVLGRIPLNPNIAKAVDEGKIEELDSYKYIERLIEKVKNL